MEKDGTWGKESVPSASTESTGHTRVPPVSTGNGEQQCGADATLKSAGSKTPTSTLMSLGGHLHLRYPSIDRPLCHRRNSHRQLRRPAGPNKRHRRRSIHRCRQMSWTNQVSPPKWQPHQLRHPRLGKDVGLFLGASARSAKRQLNLMSLALWGMIFYQFNRVLPTPLFSCSVQMSVSSLWTAYTNKK